MTARCWSATTRTERSSASGCPAPAATADTLFDLEICRVLAADLPDDEPDGKNDKRHGKCQDRLGWQPAINLRHSGQQVRREADHVIGDGRDGEAFNRLLKPKLKSCAIVH